MGGDAIIGLPFCLGRFRSGKLISAKGLQELFYSFEIFKDPICIGFVFAFRILFDHET